MELLYQGKVAGVTFEPAKSGVQRLVAHAATRQGEEISVTLTHNPKNPYDSDAVEVRVDDIFVGHVARPYNSKLLNVGLGNVQAFFERWSDVDGKRIGLSIEVFRKAS